MPRIEALVPLPELLLLLPGLGRGGAKALLLDDGDKLHLGRLHLVAQEAIDLQRILAGKVVDASQGGKLHLVLVQQRHRRHHLLEGATAGAVDPIGVVQQLGAVDAQANEEVVGRQKLAPLVVEQDAVGLQIVGDHHPLRLVFALQLDHLAKIVEPEQGRLAPCQEKMISGYSAPRYIGGYRSQGSARPSRESTPLVLQQIPAC